jgi:IS5 family transposase
MLIDKYEKDNILRRIPGLTLKLHPELAAIDRVLEDEKLFRMICDDLSQRYPKTLNAGRHSTPVEVVLRMLAVRHMYNLSYERTELHVADSLILRQFCRVYFHTVPDHTTLCKWAAQIQPETLQAFNERVVAIAVDEKLTRGRKLRTDGMVVETNIHHPTDSRLLADSVRVIGRSLSRARAVLNETTELGRQVFRNRTRSAQRAARQIARLSRRGRQHTRSTYRRLVDITRATVRQAEQVLDDLEKHAQEEGQALIQTLETFGHKVWLGEVEGGLISQYRVLDGNPADDAQWEPTLERHVDQFGHPPWQASADRGVFSADNETVAEQLGVQRIILPKPGHKSTARKERERQPWFRRGRRFHAGIEGRISVVIRKHGLDRCRDKGKTGFDRWVGWGVIANNLTIMGRRSAA